MLLRNAMAEALNGTSSLENYQESLDGDYAYMQAAMECESLLSQYDTLQTMQRNVLEIVSSVESIDQLTEAHAIQVNQQLAYADLSLQNLPSMEASESVGERILRVIKAIFDAAMKMLKAFYTAIKNFFNGFSEKIRSMRAQAAAAEKAARALGGTTDVQEYTGVVPDLSLLYIGGVYAGDDSRPTVDMVTLVYGGYLSAAGHVGKKLLENIKSMGDVNTRNLEQNYMRGIKLIDELRHAVPLSWTTKHFWHMGVSREVAHGDHVFSMSLPDIKSGDIKDYNDLNLKDFKVEVSRNIWHTGDTANIPATTVGALQAEIGIIDGTLKFIQNHLAGINQLVAIPEALVHQLDRMQKAEMDYGDIKNLNELDEKMKAVDFNRAIRLNVKLLEVVPTKLIAPLRSTALIRSLQLMLRVHSSRLKIATSANKT